MKRVINKKAYDTEMATRIATNDFSDGTNKFNCGRTKDLYRTKKGNYFVVHLTCWQGEHDSLTPLSQGEAIEVYENMFDQREEFENAFPDVKIEEA
ncbi:hypothetical protein KA005_19305 [bacterium]|nr:hypothetical protein [bacterium]